VSTAPRVRIAVLGGGITGLAAAHRLVEIAPQAEVVLFEAENRLGGILETVQRGEYLVERSADMFTTREPWALDLCRRVGLADELIETDPRYRKALIVFRGKLYPVPEGFQLLAPSKLWPLATSPLLSAAGKLRMAGEIFVPARRNGGDESLASFVRRRLGREAFERLVQPLVGGIYTADPEKLSMAATLPQFLEMERKHGSLLRGILKSRSNESASPKVSNDSGARYGQFLAPRRGMSQIIRAIADRLPAGSVRTGVRVTGISRQENAWRVQASDQPAESFDALIYALPAYTRELLRQVDEPLAEKAAQIEHAGCSVVLLGYRRQDVEHPLNAFGFVAPAIERRRVIAGSLASVKFAGRAPDDRVLLRVFIGGALQPELALLPDEDLIAIAREELRSLLGVRGEAEFAEVARWLGKMPQYHVGHLDRVAQIEARAAEIPKFALAGNAYRGVGIPFCIRSGEQAAERIAEQLQLGN
jgi:protoporphyrinogen/coproporphyrinogen III oxidase